MNSKKKRIIAVVLCLCMFAGIVTEGGGFSALAGALNKWTTKQEDLSEKKQEADLGSAENPFTVLEIVPTLDQAQFGYFIPGCEPVDMDRANRNFSQVDWVFSGETLDGVFKKKEETLQAFYEEIPSDTSYNVNVNAKYDDYKVREFKNGYDTTGYDTNNWIQNGYSANGYFEKVADGTGDFQIYETDWYAYNSIPDKYQTKIKKEQASNRLYMRYCGEKQGNYKWVTTEEKADTDYSVNKIWMKRDDGFTCHTKEYVNQDVFIKNVFNAESCSEKNPNGFHTQVITLTPEMLAEEKNMELIDTADLIYLHDGRACPGLVGVYHFLNENAADTNQNTITYFKDHDLTCKETIAITRRMGGDNPAALIMDMAALSGGKELNVYKLTLMNLIFDPTYFCNTFMDDLTTNKAGDGSEKLYYDKAENDTLKMEWENRTFQYHPKSGADLSEIARYWNINSGGYNVFDKIYTYHGDKSLLQDLINGGGIYENKDMGLWANNKNSSVFDYYEYVNGKRPDSVKNLEAVHYILSQDGYKPSIRILEIQPCDSFIYDGSKEKDAAWKKYYKSIFGWYKPKGVTNDSWMDDPNYLKIDTMTSYQFIGSVGTYTYEKNKVLTTESSDDLTAKYDLIIIGSNQDETNGKDGYNDTSLENLIYTSTGDRIVTEKNAKDGEDNKKAVADFEQTKYETRYSGNDITLKKMLELESFMRAGKPVVFDENLYKVDTKSLVVDTGKVDQNSKLYDLMNWNDTTNYKGSENRFIHGYINGGKMKQALGYERCRLVFESVEGYPVEYDYTSQNTANASGVIEQEVYNAKNKDGTATLRYQFHILGSASEKYRVYLNMDMNGDGVYSGSLKEQAETMNTNVALDAVNESAYSVVSNGWKMTGGVKNESRYMEFEKAEAAKSVLISDQNNKLGSSDGVLLEANKTYTVKQEIPSYQQGIIPWKLEVHADDNPYMRSSAIDYTAVLNQRDTEKLNVLQICPTIDMNTEWNRLLYYTTKEVNVTGEFNAASDYPAMSRTIDGLTDVQIQNAKKFETYLNPVKEFNVNIQYLTNEDWRTLFPKGTNDASQADKETATEDWKTFLSQYDMVILGFRDSLSFTNKTVFVEGLKDFIAQGKSVILSHDLVYYENDSYAAYVPWLRTVSGQRRAYYNKNSAGNYDISYTKTKMNGEQISFVPAKLSEGGFLRQTSYEIDGTTLGGVELPVVSEFIDNATRNLAYVISAKNRIRDRMHPYVKVEAYDNAIDRGKLHYDRKEAWRLQQRGWPVYTVQVSVTNRGQITNYPYKIGDTIKVSNTHAQNYQLDLEPEREGDVNVWFNLAGTLYNFRKQDSRNNFFIFNKGNITYTGSGHTSNQVLTDDEVILFVNTMISAYRVPEGKPVIQIENADTTGTNGISYFYLDYDEKDTSHAVDGNVIMRDGKKYVAVEFKISDNDVTNSGFSKTHRLLIYKNGDAVNVEQEEKEGKTQVRDKENAGLSIVKVSDKQVGYTVKPTLNGKEYILYVPYEEIAANGNVTYKLSTYGEYDQGGTIKKTPASSASVTIMKMPLFDLD